MELLRRLHETRDNKSSSETMRIDEGSINAVKHKSDTDVLEDPIYGLKKTDTELIKLLRWMKKNHPDQYEKMTQI